MTRLGIEENGSRIFAHVMSTKVPEGASTGAIAGGVLGALFGLYAGAGELVGWSSEQIVAAGPFVVAAAGFGAGGALGGLLGALIGMCFPEIEARRFPGNVKGGSTLLSVHCRTRGEALRATEILAASGAKHVASVQESTGI
jgi:hypothetical protein